MEDKDNLNQEGDPSKESKGAPVSLKRSVGVPGAVALLVGTMIGSGIFATPKWVLMYAGSVGMSLVMWVLCGLIALFGALCYCELGTLIPKSGGEYAYLMAGYGGMMGFLYSYTSVLFVKPSGIMILLVFGAYIIEPFFPGCGGREDLVPLVKILAAAALGKFLALLCKHHDVISCSFCCCATMIMQLPSEWCCHAIFTTVSGLPLTFRTEMKPKARKLHY